MAEHTPHQEKIIAGYYEHKSEIMLAKLEKIVSELYLADSDKKRDRLWTRVAGAMKALNVPKSTADHILKTRQAELLALHLRKWLGATEKR